jgi:hypothetical protein
MLVTKDLSVCSNNLSNLLIIPNPVHFTYDPKQRFWFRHHSDWLHTGSQSEIALPISCAESWHLHQSKLVPWIFAAVAKDRPAPKYPISKT